MNKIFSKILVLVFAVLCMTACESSSPEALLSQGEDAVSNGNLEEARSCCQSLLQEKNLTPSQLCRQALIYARLFEQSDNSDDLAAAAQCYAAALEANPDSVAAFVASLDVESLCAFASARGLNRVMEGGCDMDCLECEQYGDSIMYCLDEITQETL